LVRGLKTPWRILLITIFDEERDEIHFLSTRRRGKGDKFPVDRRTCASALRLAAKRRGVDALKPHEYAEEREKVIGSSRGINRQQKLLRWPNGTQIEHFGWSQISREAGLEVPEQTKGRNSGLPYTEGLRVFLEHFGYLPAEIPFRRAFVDRGLHLAVADMNHTESIAELHRQRATVGLWTPSRRLIGNRDTVPEIPESVEVAFEAEMSELKKQYISTPRGHWNLERVESAMDRALEKLPAGRCLTRRKFDEMSRGDPTMPFMSAVQRVCAKNDTTFATLREEALRRRERRFR
jgi:hypothetical protein